MRKYLDLSGLLSFWTAIKNYVMQAITTVRENSIGQISVSEFSISTNGWIENSSEERFEATISKVEITVNSRVTIILGDSCKGKFNICALDPMNGSVKLISVNAPGETISGRVIIDEVRT